MLGDRPPNLAGEAAVVLLGDLAQLVTNVSGDVRVDERLLGCTDFSISETISDG
jgi:hypothetical protein